MTNAELMRDADRLAVVWENNVTGDARKNVVAPGNFIHWRELNQSFKELSAVSMTLRTTLALVAALAASVPGLRATRVDPVIALRSE